jgi:hypothetical protein
MESIAGNLATRRTALVQELMGWLRLRSVAGLPEHEIDLTRSANWLAGTLREIGFPTVEVWPGDGGPAARENPLSEEKQLAGTPLGKDNQ